MRALRSALAGLFSLFMVLGAAFALDPLVIGQSERALQEYRTSLDQISGLLRKPVLSDKEIADAKIALEKIRVAGAEFSAKAGPAIDQVNQQLALLGTPPGDRGDEDAGVAKTRADLTTARDKLQSLKTRFDIIGVEAQQASARATALQRDRFFERIFDRNRSIFNPALWYDTVVGIGTMGAGLSLLLRNWWSEVAASAQPLGLLLVPLFILVFALGVRLIRRWAASISARYASRHSRIDDLGRLWRIVRCLLMTAAALIMLIGPIRLALDASGYFTPRILLVWDVVAVTLLGGVFFWIMARKIAAPGQPEWRIVDLDERAASRFAFLAGLIALLSTLHAQLTRLAEGLYLGVNYTAGQSALAALVLLGLTSLLLMALKNQEGLPDPAGRRVYFGWVSRLKPAFWLIILIGFGALALGYLALADFLAHQLARTSMFMGLLFLLYYFCDAAVTASFDPQSGFGIFLRRMTGLGERGIERLGLVIRTGVDLVFILAGIPLLLLLWTLTWVDFTGVLHTLTHGITIGQITISPGMVAMALLVFACGIAATRLFNRWLARRILGDTHINRGVQDSILKGASYAGYALAGVVALSAAGLDLSNLALIAGALGLGIGLGLQSIVNNFVSGLIILAERPIRVGDWVSLPSGEGVVRRINARSTEIETFDACSIIVPNSLLVTEPVRNWTHNDNMGRFLIAVSLDYQSDAETVRKLLVETARSHSKVLTHPEPSVILARFGTSGLDFELRAFVADIFEAGGVASDIRFRLLELFRENGISIAQPVAITQTKGT